MKYVVQTVAEHELPDGVEHVIVEREDDPPLLLLAGETARCWRWMRRWEDTVEPPWQPTICLPADED